MNQHPAFGTTVAFLSLVVFAWEALAQESLPTLVKRIQPTVVTVNAYDEDGQPLQQGSGFFINKEGHLITNRHVLHGASRAEVKTHDGKGYAVKMVVAEDKDGDLIRVVVDIPADDVRALQITNVVPEVGERVVVVGSPLGWEQTVSEGIVSAVRDIPGLGKIVQLTASISPGSSGSPVVNMKGEIIGVATMQMTEGQNLNFAMSGEQVLALKLQKGRTLAEWTANEPKEWAATIEDLYSKGLNFLRIEDWAKALSFFEKAAEQAPHFAQAWLYIGYCQAELGHHEEAVKTYKKAIDLQPEDTPTVYHNLGVAYGNLGHWQEAVKAYQQAIRLDPDDAQTHYNLGEAYFNLGDKDSALKEHKILKTLDQSLANKLFDLIAAREPVAGQEHQGSEVSVGEIRGNKRSKIYHLPGCPNYDRLNPANVVPFKTEEEAIQAGYRKAGNCR